MGRAIACPTSSGPDPESIGLDLISRIEKLLTCLQRDAADAAPYDLLQFVVVDRTKGDYRRDLDEARLRQWGITLIDMDLVDPDNPPYLDPAKLTPVLLSLA